MAKERISLTLEQDIIDRIDRKLAEKGIENRSQGIEQVLEEYLKDEAVTTALVLAGGDDPDCRIPVNGRPVLDHILDHLESSGVTRVFIATGDDDMDAAVGDHDVNIEYVIEEQPLGTAGSLRRVRDEVNDTLLVVNGDVLCPVDLADMTAAHEETGGLATIALTTVKDSSDYGVIQMKRNKVVGFQEKPDESRSHLVNAGIYLVEPDLIDQLPSEDEQRAVDFEAVFERLADEQELNGYVYDGEWREVG